MVGLIAAALALGACAATDFSKEGAGEAQFLEDESLCRAQVRRMTATQRTIDDSRQDTYRAEQERFGQTTLPATMAAQNEKVRTGKLMESCMTARGWQPKGQWWQRLGS